MRVQGVQGQCHVKRVRRTKQQMKPGDVSSRIEEKLQHDEAQNRQDGVEWEEIRPENDQEVGFRDNDMPPLGVRFQRFDSAAKKPSPDRMSQLMSDHVKPHRLRQQQIHDAPARSAREQRDPDRVSLPGFTKNSEQCMEAPYAKWQQ